ncbi:hypothetical protein BT63DRAFT_456740 [Microthyrium microscopicum]|uniref:Uncharacterized protein n=1 Tax=Microthyrium microscopicum TaxID=703497 RepID=A0A6A6U968_9PEZI|nr:hypothetical protein BT63DRAFT_456740 [Microthyrium microscopicum]
MTSVAGPKSFFAFTRLPFEIQSMILVQTELVADSRPASPGIPISGNFKALSTCDRQCGATKSLNRPDCPECPDSGCYCMTTSLKHSSSCIYNPLHSSALFAVDSSIREQALQIYYRQNLFRLSGSAFEVLRELKSVPKERLYLVRNICVDYESSDFPSRNHSEPTDDWERLCALLHLICKNFNLQRLNITFNFNASWEPLGGDHWFDELTRPPSWWFFGSSRQQRLLRQLCKLLTAYGLSNVTVNIEPGWWHQKLPCNRGHLLTVCGPGEEDLIEKLCSL